MGGVRMSEDEGDEKERSISWPCVQILTHACAQGHIYMCRYIHSQLHQLVHGYAHMHSLRMYAYAHNIHTFCLFHSLLHTHIHTHTHRCAHSHCRRGVNAVGTWFPSLHTHSSLRRGPDRTLCPTGHGSTHTHTSIHTCHYTVTHMHR